MTGPAGGTGPSDGRGPTEAQLVVPRAGNRGLVLGATVIAAVVVLAVLKPWGAPGGTGQATDAALASSRPAAASLGPTPTPSPTPPGYDAPGGQCFTDSDWRVFTIETHEDRPQRHWLTIEPGAAASPRDTAVPFVTVVTDQVLALGFCVGSGSDGPAPLVGVRGWAVGPGGAATALTLNPVRAHMPPTPDLGAVYRPPADADVAAAAWAPGRYVFAVRQGPPGGEEWWFGVEVVVAPSATAAPGTSGAPGTSAAPGSSPGASSAP
jgi:hypothetical protein